MRWGVILAIGVSCALGTLAQPLGWGDARNLEASHTRTRFVPVPLRDVYEWMRRRAQLRQQVLVAAGLDPLPERNPLNPRERGRVEFPAYRIEKIRIETFPGFFLHGNLYVPTGRRGPLPAVLIPHGHWKRGRVQQDEDYSVPALGQNLAAKGYVAFAYDMVGYNETKQLPHRFGDSPAEQLWSFHPLGIQLWNSIRALDFLSAHPLVDRRRVAVTGASGGGTQTFLLAAVDDRVAVSAPAVMVSYRFQGDDACEMAPGLRIGTNNVEFAALFAPKPQLLLSSSKDWTRETPEAEFPALQYVYRLFGVPSMVAAFHQNAPHNYNRASREALYAFLAKHLGGSGGRESEFRVLPESLLLSEDVGERLPNAAQLFEAWKDSAERQSRALTASALRSRLRATLRVEFPTRVQTLVLGGQTVLVRDGSGDRVPVSWEPGTSPSVAVVVHDQGSVAARRQFDRRSGESALYVDVFQTGLAEAPRAPSNGDYLVFHPSDDSHRVQDILSAVAYARDRSPAVRLVCLGRASWWCLAAAAVAPGPLPVEFNETPERGSDEDFRRYLYVPGLQRAGGLRVLLQLSSLAADVPPPTESTTLHDFVP